MDTFAFLGSSFGLLGFVFGVSALAQFRKLDGRIKRLELPKNQK